MIGPNAQAMLDFARPGDTIVVWRLGRLGRSLTHLIKTVMGLQARRINFRSLTEHVDMSTPGGKCTFHLFGARAEMERDVIRQRTRAGLEAARARGRIEGRPALHPDARKLQWVRELYEKKEMSIAEIMALTGFASRYSFYKYVVHAGADALSAGKKRKRPKDAKRKAEKRNRRGCESQDSACGICIALWAVTALEVHGSDHLPIKKWIQIPPAESWDIHSSARTSPESDSLR